MKALHMVSWILVIIGGLSWGIIGVSGVNIVSYVGPTLATVVYILVGLAAIYEIISHKKTCKCCDKSSAPSM